MYAMQTHAHQTSPQTHISTTQPLPCGILAACSDELVPMITHDSGSVSTSTMSVAFAAATCCVLVVNSHPPRVTTTALPWGKDCERGWHADASDGSSITRGRGAVGLCGNRPPKPAGIPSSTGGGVCLVVLLGSCIWRCTCDPSGL